MDTYIYDGPIYRFSRLFYNHWYGETRAVSAQKALVNLSFKAKQIFGMQPFSSLTLNPKFLTCTKREDNKDTPNTKEIKHCPKCGAVLTDGGYCPVCDDGDFEYFDDTINEGYPEPKKLYSLDNKKATWDSDAEDFIYWDSESKYDDKYATCYKCRMNPKDFLDLTTAKGAASLEKGNSLGLGKLRDLDIDEFNKEKRQPIFLVISFEGLVSVSNILSGKYTAKVVNHEGCHRMFALMRAGIEEVDVQLKVIGNNYNKYAPYKIKELDLLGQFNENIVVKIKDPIIMSLEKHKEINPRLRETAETTLEEKIEKHDILNPKLWNEDKTLKDDVAEKIKAIVKEFTDELEADGIKFKVKDIRLVGSNCSYNYTEDSDLDVHIIMDESSLNCPDNLYPLLYSSYRSLFNKSLNIDFYGIPVEIYVEME